MISTILSRFANLSSQKMLIFAVMLAGFYYFSMFDDGSSIETRIVQMQQSIDQEQIKARESDAAIKKVEQIRASIATLNEQFKIAAQQLPAEIQAAEILRTVDTLAKSAGVSIKSKEPRATQKQDILEVLPLHVVIQGSYSEITMFLYYISIMERISRVFSFTLSEATTDAAKAKSNSITFDGEIVSYRYLPEAIPKEVKK